MAASPEWKVYDASGTYQAACKEIEATTKRIDEEHARHKAAVAEGPGWVIVDDAGQRMSDVYLQDQRKAAEKGARWRAKLYGRPMHVAPAKATQYADLRTLGDVADAYDEMEREAGDEGVRLRETGLRGDAWRSEPAPRTDHMAEDCAAIAARHGDGRTAAAVAHRCRRVQVILVMRRPAPPAATYVHLNPRMDH